MSASNLHHATMAYPEFGPQSWADFADEEDRRRAQADVDYRERSSAFLEFWKRHASHKAKLDPRGRRQWVFYLPAVDQDSVGDRCHYCMCADTVCREHQQLPCGRSTNTSGNSISML